MHIHLRVQHWVVWWFYLGVAGAVVALANILGRDLTRTQDSINLLVGVAHWVLGGLVCYAYDSIRIEQPPAEQHKSDESPRMARKEWHPASDFVLPGNRKSILPHPKLHY
jgi:hypothetical protein